MTSSTSSHSESPQNEKPGGVRGSSTRPVSFFIPAYNCAETVRESVLSIVEGNLEAGDEIVIVDDCSSDETPSVLQQLQNEYSFLRVYTHERNRGGGAARNTAIVHARHEWLFCLDSDNVLVHGSLRPLRRLLENSGVEIAAFEEVRYFTTDMTQPTHSWYYKPVVWSLREYLSTNRCPGASGNYLFTRESWQRAGGYPEYAGALDTWGFGLRQAATASRCVILPHSYYNHRYSHESYWVREAKQGQVEVKALQLLLPFLHLLHDVDADYIMSRRGRYWWYPRLGERPLRTKKAVVERGDAEDTSVAERAVAQAQLRQLPQRILRKISRVSRRVWRRFH